MHTLDNQHSQDLNKHKIHDGLILLMISVKFPPQFFCSYHSLRTLQYNKDEDVGVLILEPTGKGK